jgi:hypothetical protein
MGKSRADKYKALPPAADSDQPPSPVLAKVTSKRYLKTDDIDMSFGVDSWVSAIESPSDSEPLLGRADADSSASAAFFPLDKLGFSQATSSGETRSRGFLSTADNSANLSLSDSMFKASAFPELPAQTPPAQEKKGLPTSPALSGQSPFLPSFDHTTKASRILSRVAM